ncbi:Carboxy-terminal processing protease CtpB precursor [Novipirellula aureliae]|uniref:Carboxy-terminal processing protease CtpB n=1 Tax=Novipirellula aureliae TaxID=2527966 RepID=A0A5C6EBE5_9BACT|nr:S41 family peptidase [Novipirellula aureliae]TWU45774.1 Carboxy-terminal processing protease CtpB precursor [Novipirellula aureliae]
MDWINQISGRLSRRCCLRIAVAGSLTLASLLGCVCRVSAQGPSWISPKTEAAHSSSENESEPTSLAPIHSDDELLTIGLEFEQSHLWADAVRHYEKAIKKYPENAMLYQRMVIAKLHYDVNRRYQDSSFVSSIDQLSTEQALDLYSEILANLQTHYVDDVDWGRVMLHGTAALEVALTEDRFASHLLQKADPNAVEHFRQNVHHELTNRSTSTRFDLRANVAYVAGIAKERIGLSPTATILEYVGGAVSTLDPYTRLLSGNQLDEMFSNIEGNFVGLGIELKAETDYLQIVSVIPGGPAEQAGIVAGDRIVRVDDCETTNGDSNYAADLLRGPENSFVSIRLTSANGTTRDLTVERRRVEVPCVENVHLVDLQNKVGYLRLTNFQKTTTRDVEQALWDLHRQGMQSLIIDVRGNPGGLLSAAVEVADRFLGNGRIVTTRGRNVRENFDYTAHRANTWNIPMAVLIDRDSASASEIFAGAIADSGRGEVVGETSYGKGSVQGIFRMQAAKFGLCLTTAKFYSPSGKAISQHGVDPSVPVESTYVAARPNSSGQMTTDQEDAVLQQAVLKLANGNVNANLNIEPQDSQRNWVSRRP